MFFVIYEHLLNLLTEATDGKAEAEAETGSRVRGQRGRSAAGARTERPAQAMQLEDVRFGNRTAR